MDKMKRKNKKNAGGESDSRRTNSSSKVFQNLQKIVASDYKKRDDKKEARQSGKK